MNLQEQGMNSKIIPAVVVILIMAGFACAHHSFTATYSLEKTIKIEGKIAQFIFRNPHSFVHVIVPDETGAMVRWAIEWQGAGQLGNQGMSAQTLKAGDTIIVTGNPGRDPAEHRMRMVTIRRPSDGFGWGTQPGQVVD
jgi:hypothetical protein